MNPPRVSHLDQLEAEAIHVLREVTAQAARPVLLYSVGKDSACLLRLAQKAFFPAPLPFPLLHVDTTFKFQELYAFRDDQAAQAGAELRVHRQADAVRRRANPFDLGTVACCGLWKTQGLLDALAAGDHDAAFGGARRDEERARAKERVVSLRDARGRWDPERQRPELWSLYQGRVRPGESLRVFPLANWSELDVWHYVLRERIPLPSLYFAAPRQVVVRGAQLIPVDARAPARPGEDVETVVCRFRSLGCVPCSGAVRSQADTVEAIVAELERGACSERATRVIDVDRDGSMELKKREGYF